ncbi:hypothetical protein LTR37_020780, partial [Vermiconidia calcicola]
MFRTLSGTADPVQCSELEKRRIEESAGYSNKSSASTDSDPDAVERAISRDETDHGIEEYEKVSPRPSVGLARTVSRNSKTSRISGTSRTSRTSKGLSRIASRLTTHDLEDPGPPPDGGLKAWTQIAMGWIAIATTWGWINCFGVFQTYYTLNLDISPSTISWIGTTQNFLTFFIGAFSGRLLDAGYFLPTVLVGASLQILGIFMMSLSTKYWQLFLTQGVLNGIGNGIFFTPCMGLMATWFSKKRSLAMGCASTGNAAGGIIYPIMVRELLPKLGFAWTVRVLGFMNLGLLALVVCLMKPRLPPRKSADFFDKSAFKEVPFVLFM